MHSSIERLESRIAPAGVIKGATSATYTDVDGDFVTIKFTKGALDTAVFQTDPKGLGDQLQRLEVFTKVGANITFSVKKAATGDGLVNVGEIFSDVDLGAVSIPGDLGRIVVSDTNTDEPAFKSLKVRSLGASGVLTGAANLNTDVFGAGAITIAQDLVGAFVYVHGELASLTIGGSVIGGGSASAGRVLVSGDLGTVKIGGDLAGGAGVLTGLVEVYGKMKSLTIGGSMRGSTGTSSGNVYVDLGIDTVKIGHSIIGGSGLFSGTIGVDHGEIGQLTVGQSVVGGSGPSSGYIGVTGLGAVKIAGDLIGGGGTGSGVVLAKNGQAIDSISIGRSLIGGTGTTSGLIQGGAIGAVKIGGDFAGGSGDGSGSLLAFGDVTSIAIRGSLLGGTNLNAGQIGSTGKLGPIKIGGSMIGSTGDNSAVISANQGMDTLTVSGSLVGGSGIGSGRVVIHGSHMGAVKIGGDVRGGSANFSGMINTDGFDVTSIAIGGSLIGGTADSTGVLSMRTAEKGIKIGGDIIGGSVSDTASLNGSGYIQTTASGNIFSLFVGGSIFAGQDTSTGELLRSGAVIADAIGDVTVKGSLVGNVSSGGTTRVTISAGFGVTTPTTEVVIKSLTIGGSVKNTDILGGYYDGLGVNRTAQIGAVKVKGDWIESNLVAGVQNATNSPANFGDNLDVLITPTGPNPAVVAKIASISIGGQVIGSATGHFGFVAQQIGSFKAAGFTAKLTAGTDAPIQLAIAQGGNVTIHEI